MFSSFSDSRLPEFSANTLTLERLFIYRYEIQSVQNVCDQFRMIRVHKYHRILPPKLAGQKRDFH